jgi:hypothetical protein
MFVCATASPLGGHICLYMLLLLSYEGAYVCMLTSLSYEGACVCICYSFSPVSLRLCGIHLWTCFAQAARICYVSHGHGFAMFFAGNHGCVSCGAART